MNLNDERVMWMRTQGVVQAQWSLGGEVTMLVLGPKPAPEGKDEDVPYEPEDYESVLCASS